MEADVNLAMQVANSLFTIGCGVTLLYLVYRGKLERHPFYYGWSIGFFLYGTEIYLRLISLSTYIEIPMFFAFVIFFPFSLLILRPQKNTILLFLLILFFGVLFIVLSYFGMLELSESSWIIGALFFYSPIAIIVMIHRKLFGSCVDKLIIGWFSLLLVNILFPFGGWIANTLAIFGKIILFMGIESYDFAIMTQKVHTGLTTNVSSLTSGYGEKGDFELAMLKSQGVPPLRTTCKWLKSRVDENVKRNINTSILVLQDVIPYSTLRSIAWSKPELIHIFTFSEDTSSHPEFVTLKYGITEIGATITEIAKRNSSLERKQEIILLDLSIMIHTFGANEVYRFLLNKMGTLRSNGTSLVAPFHQQTHEDSVVALFKTIAGSIIQL